MATTSVILGSGFSRAISDYMPTMGELVVEVAKDDSLDLLPLARFGNDLEQWMSFLSVDQPWLTAADNFVNKSMFLKVSDRIDQEIRRAESLVITQEPPEWLLRFLWGVSDAEASIFTFNYDTLVERGLTVLRRAQTWADLYGAPLTVRSAAGSGLSVGPGEPRGPIPTIYKLHGSTNWSFGGLSGPPNDPIVMTSDGRSWGTPANPRHDRAPRYRHLYDDLLPLIVPPTFSKGPYFSNRSLQAQWASGAKALRASDELLVIGYSFPAGDLVARQWVASSAQPNVVTVINPDEQVADTVRGLLGPDTEVVHFPNLKEYVDSHSPSLVRWRVYNSENDALGLQIDLTVNGVDMMTGIDRSNPPWNAFDETGPQWLATFLDRVDPQLRELSAPADKEEGWVRDARFVALDGAHAEITPQAVAEYKF